MPITGQEVPRADGETTISGVALAVRHLATPAPPPGAVPLEHSTCTVHASGPICVHSGAIPTLAFGTDIHCCTVLIVAVPSYPANMRPIPYNYAQLLQ